MRYIFGPVPSRRLGLSLGIDMIPFKTCSFDCIYCQLGRTTSKTTVRSSFANTEELVFELKETLSRTTPNYITFSGSGEPTLNRDLGKLIKEVKGLTSVPVAVLTNSSLLSSPDVRAELLDADLVIPSLDAASQETFERINRPCPGLTVDEIIAGIKAFSSEFKGKLWIEVMVVKGVNDDEGELSRISSVLSGVKAEKIQLNTVERPPAESFAKPLSATEMERAKGFFDERVEIISSSDSWESPVGSPSTGEESVKDRYGQILSLLKRRPCTMIDVSNALGLNINEASKYLGALLRLGLITSESPGGGKAYFYRGSSIK